MIKVSIIIPVYNSESFLSRCLDSAVRQTLDDCEIICVNDGSTDNSLKILNNYKNKYDNIVIIDLKRNGGVANARNKGINAAKGEYVGFIDSDDYVDDGYFKNLYDYSIGNDYDLIRGIRVIDEENKFAKNPYGCIVPSIIKMKLLREHPRLRFPVNLKVGEDSTFKRWLYSTTDKIFEVPNNGVYYHYLRRSGSLSNYNL